jgi:hypothetical protein
MIGSQSCATLHRVIKGRKVVLFMPAYNAARTIRRTVEELPRDVVHVSDKEVLGPVVHFQFRLNAIDGRCSRASSATPRANSVAGPIR